MRFYVIAPTKRLHSEGYFTYHSQKSLKIGSIVQISVGNKVVVGIVIKAVTKPSFPTKPIIETLVSTPLPVPLLKTADWLKEYYDSPVSAIWQTLLPRGLEKKRRPEKSVENHIVRKKKTFQLTLKQQQAVNRITQNTETTSLLHGVTGSGKTAVYIEIAQKIFREKKSIIILVPEIALTSQLVAEFKHFFTEVIVTHSQMTERERHLVWLRCLESNTPLVVIGPRSALFLPLQSIGLIVIDECHEPSYKQDQSPRYQTTRVARIVANHHKARLVLGSATPLISDYYLAQRTNQSIITISSPAQSYTKPEIAVIDYKNKSEFSQHSFLSTKLLEAIDRALHNKTQVLLFHNRRGSAPYTLCENCGWTATCNQCHIPMNLHADQYQLVCHSCGVRHTVPKVCPECQHAQIIHKGIGTKRIEAEITKLFKNVRIARFDGDNKKDDALHTQYQALYDGTIDIIIGTQIIAKGLDLPKLSVVGIIQADAGLTMPDFTSEERVFQLLSQTMGRVGRSNQMSTIIVQTYQPDHIAITTALRKDYKSFYQHSILVRRRALLPPFAFLMKLRCQYASETGAEQAAKKLYRMLQQYKVPELIITPPTPAFYEKVGGNFRWQIVIKSKSRSELKKLLPHIPPAKWQVDIDPQSLL